MKSNTLLLMMATTGLFSCGQVNKRQPATVDKETINSTRRFEYADAMSKHVTIISSLPKGSTYIAPTGKKYFKVVFWSRIVNETDSPLEMNIYFPEELYEVPGLPGNYYKILVPPDTMTVDKEPLFDYGTTALKSFLDASFDKPSSITRTIQPKDSTGFYVVILSQTTEITPGSTLRTGLAVKGQKLVYKISRYASTKDHPLISEKAIDCGSINFKNLVLQK